MLKALDTPDPKSLWLSKRLGINANGSYELSGSHGGSHIKVELDQSITSAWLDPPERAVIQQHKQLQAAARRKWDEGVAVPVHFAHSGRLQHFVIVLNSNDLASLATSKAHTRGEG